jgi:hypothetical protein
MLRDINCYRCPEITQFGFPPPGHEYWNEQTLHDVGRRYPGMDMEPYIRATG